MKDWDAYYDWEWESNTCTLCATWLKRVPGSDERILAISDDKDFTRTAIAYRSPDDARALWDERMRRERERRLKGRN